MPGQFKTEAVVLRSFRYGEADRILHLYTAERGRVGAIAKGVRRVKSRFGGRLEPLFRVNLVLHEGRGELCTVTQAETVAAHPALRERRESLERATQACDAVLRLFDSRSRTGPPTTCSAASSSCSTPSRGAATRAHALAFRLKLLLAAGFVPELAACASCGDREHLGALLGQRRRRRLPGLRGRLVRARRRGPPASSSTRSATRWRTRPRRPTRALRQADRAIAETLEHHAHVRLRRVAEAAANLRALWPRDQRDEVRLRLLRGLARHARPARRQGRERRRDDAHPRRRARARRASRSRPRRASPT